MSSSEGEATRSPRFMQWVAFLVFSVIVLGSAIEAAENSQNVSDDTLPAHRWAVACAGTTFALAFIAVVMHLFPRCALFIVGTRLEGFLCLLLVAFWSAQVAIVTDPSHGLAVNSDGAVSNGNLYYFSWAGLVCAIVMGASYLRSVYHVDVGGEIRNRASRLGPWSALVATSFVVMGCSANIFDHACWERGDVYCRRTVFGISLGALSAVLSLYVVGMKIVTRKTFFVVEALFSTLLIVSFAFGVALITAESGPGAPLGNLYYFTWASFFVDFMLCASLYEEYHVLRYPPHNSQADGGSLEGGGGETQAIHHAQGDPAGMEDI